MYSYLIMIINVDGMYIIQFRIFQNNRQTALNQTKTNLTFFCSVLSVLSNVHFNTPKEMLVTLGTHGVSLMPMKNLIMGG